MLMMMTTMTMVVVVMVVVGEVFGGGGDNDECARADESYPRLFYSFLHSFYGYVAAAVTLALSEHTLIQLVISPQISCLECSKRG